MDKKNDLSFRISKKIRYVDFCYKIEKGLEPFYLEAKEDNGISLSNTDKFLLHVLTQGFGLDKKEAKDIVDEVAIMCD